MECYGIILGVFFYTATCVRSLGRECCYEWLQKFPIGTIFWVGTVVKNKQILLT